MSCGVFKIKWRIPGVFRMKRRQEQCHYSYKDWEFKQSYPENDERAISAKVKRKELSDYENIVNLEDLCMQSKFEDIQSWLDSFYDSCEEDTVGVDDDSVKSFYTCFDVKNCSTFKRSLFDNGFEKSRQDEEKKAEESEYSLQLRSKSKTIFKTL